MAVSFIFGQHGSGKSKYAVACCEQLQAQYKVPIYLVASTPSQIDKATGKPTFPPTFIRSDIKKICKVTRAGIIIDDMPEFTDDWENFRTCLKEFRQRALDIYISFHSYSHVADKLSGYGTRMVCFRTNTRIPYSNNFAYKKEMEAARQYIQNNGGLHSFFIVDNTTGKINIVL